MSNDKVFNAIIKGYREVINQRYNYKRLNKNYNLPSTIDEAIVEEIKYFFLNYIYPDIDKRKELNDAFKTLDENLKNPEKLLGLLRESIKLIFKHGRHLPKIINAGFKALKSFRTATKFENRLVEIAKENKKKPPYNSTAINEMISYLSRNEIEQFMESTESLFQIMYDKVLVEKIIEVISYLIERMQKKKHVFSTQEIKGLQIGLEMITKGYDVLNSLSKDNQDLLIQFILTVERDNLDELFS